MVRHGAAPGADVSRDRHRLDEAACALTGMTKSQPDHHSWRLFGSGRCWHVVCIRLRVFCPEVGMSNGVVEATNRRRDRARADSALSGFHKLSMEERRALLQQRTDVTRAELQILDGGGLEPEQAERMVENAIGLIGVPMGVCANLTVDGRDRVVPMATEEPSVIAAASHGAKLLRRGGGVFTEAAAPLMEGQIQLLDVPDVDVAQARIKEVAPRLLSAANASHPRLVAAGGGARWIRTRLLPPNGPDDPLDTMVIVHVCVDVRDAMGANAINSICEQLAGDLERLSGGRALLRILTNLCDRRTVVAVGRVPVAALGKTEGRGRALARSIVEASVFAERDPYRAATHNKGIMNGVDAVMLACGQDWRAIEAAAHSFASRSGRYRPLAHWRIASDMLEGRIEMPTAVGIVGGAVQVHPAVQASLHLAGIATASSLARLVTAVGLAQNLAALRALASEGIQKGHMRLHARRTTLRVAPSRADHEEDEAFCAEILPRVSRTFALSIAALPPGIGEVVRTAYLLCRIVDTVEDEPGLDPVRRKRLFDVFDRQVERDEVSEHLFRDASAGLRGGADGAEAELCRRSDAVFREFRRLSKQDREVIRPHLLEMSHGMRLYAARGDLAGGRLRIADVSDLERYCYFVAGTVGMMLTELFEMGVPGLSSEARLALRGRAVAFGQGLQLVNILKDVAEDAARGSLFLPRDLLAHAHLEEHDLLAPERRSDGMTVVAVLADRARAHLERAVEYTLAWPVEGGRFARVFCAVPLALALATLEEIERGEETLRSGRTPKVTRSFLMELLERVAAAAGDDRALSRLFGELSVDDPTRRRR